MLQPEKRFWRTFCIEHRRDSREIQLQAFVLINARLRRELFELGKEPDRGDVAWLIQRVDQPITGKNLDSP